MNLICRIPTHLIALAALGLAVPAGAQTVTVSNQPITLNVGNIVQGSSSTTFTVDGSGAVTRGTGGTAVRLGSSPSVGIFSAQVNCTGGNGNPCTRNSSSSSITVSAGTKPSGAPVGSFSLASLKDSTGATIPATSNSPAATLTVNVGQVTNWPLTVTVSYTVVVSSTSTTYGVNTTPYSIVATLN